MKELTPQVKILTGMMAGISEKDGFVLNPFYKQSVDTIKANWEYAKDIYKDVFNNFLSAHIRRQLEENNIPIGKVPLHMIENIIKANSHIIERPPEEWRELKA